MIKTIDEYIKINRLKVLDLTIKKKWFDMILYLIKNEEYREIKSYWEKRLSAKYDIVKFRNGYNLDSPCFYIKLLSIEKGYGLVKWGAPKNKRVYILKLGEIICKKYINYDNVLNLEV